MTDTATAETAAPDGVTPTVTDESSGAVQETPPEAAPPAEDTSPSEPAEPPKRLTKREARKAMREDRARRQAESAKQAETAGEETETGAEPAGESEEVVVDEKGRRRDPETGKFLPAEDGGEDAQDADGEEAVGEQDTKPEAAEEQAPEQDTDEDESAADEAGDGRRVVIAEDHPIREMGLDAFTVSSEIEEQAVQALLNGTYNRRKEVEAATERANTLETRNRELEQKLIEMESTQTATEKWKQTPEYRAAVEKYQQIREEIGPEAATTYWKGVQDSLQKMVDEEKGERTAAIEARELDEAAKQWKSEAWTRIETKLPEHIRKIPEFGRWVEEEISFLNDRLEAGRLPNVTNAEEAHAELGRLLSIRLSREPAVKAVYSKIKEEERQSKAAEAQKSEEQRQAAAKDSEKAVDDFKKKTADKRKETPPNPIAGMKGADVHGASGSGDEGESGPDVDSMSPTQLRKHYKKQARQDARRRFGT